MAEQVNVYEAKTHLSKLLERVEAGEEIVIARHGRAVARLVPAQRAGRGTQRRLGGLEGHVYYTGHWSDGDEEIEALFYGEAPESASPHEG